MSSTQLSRWTISSLPRTGRPEALTWMSHFPWIYFSCSGPQTHPALHCRSSLCSRLPLQILPQTVAGVPKATAPQGGAMSAHVLRGEANVIFTDASLTLIKHGVGVGLQEERLTASWDYVTEQKGNNLGSQIVLTHQSVAVHWYKTEGLGWRQAFPALSWMTFLQSHNPAPVWFTGSLKINRGQRCDKRPVIGWCWFPRLV